MAAKTIFNNTKQQRESLFTALYKKAFPAVAKYVCKMGGSFEQAKDVFQDALVIYYEKLINGHTAINQSAPGYLYGIAQNLWIKTYHRESKTTSIDTEPGADMPVENTGAASENMLLNYLETAGKKCMEILKAFYYDRLPVEEIARIFGYAGVRSATVQKYKCLEKIRETIKEKSLTYADFIE